MSIHELVITEDGDLEFRCNAKPTDGVSPECWFTAEGEDLGACHAFKRMDSIELYAEIVIPVDVSWMGPDNSPVLTSCWEDELEEPHSRDNRISRKPPYASSLYCSCNQGPSTWECQIPLVAFSTENDAQAFCTKLQARRKRHEDAHVRFYAKLDLLQETMSFDEAWARAGKEPQCPKDDYPEYYVEELVFHARAAS